MNTIKPILCSALLSLSITGFTQTEAIENYKKIVTNVFSGIPTQKITTGHLIEKAVPTIDISNYSGMTDSDTATFSVWKKLYNEYYLSHTDYSSVDYRYDFEYQDSNSTNIQLGLLCFDYNQIKTTALQSKQIVMDSARGIFIDKTNLEVPTLDKHTCAVLAPFCDIKEPGTFGFTLLSENMIGSLCKDIQNLSINFDDGRGYIPISPNIEYVVNYDEPGTKTIEARFTISGKTHYCFSSIYIEDKSSYHTSKLKSATLTIEPSEGPTEYYSNDLKAEYATFHRCNSDGNIRKPYMIVSGFDPMDKNRMVDDGNKVNLYRVSNKNGYLDQLRNDGYDIIIYRSKESTRSIIDNALNLVSFIQKINTEKTSDNELIIAGASMGGLVVRYALTYMEYHKIDHQTKLFISVDSPQEGANVPLGIQYMVKYLNKDLIDAIDALKDAEKKMLNSEAAKEMLIYHHSGTSGKTAQCAQERTDFLTEIRKIGNFPKQCRSISISMGSGTGKSQGFNDGALLLDKDPKLSILVPGLTPVPRLTWEFSVYGAPKNTEKTIYKESVKMQTCYRLLGKTYCNSLSNIASRDVVVNNTMPIDNAPGSIQNLHNTKAFRGNGSILGLDYLDIISQLGDIEYDSHPDNFIPTFSALGLQNINNPHVNAKTYLMASGKFNRLSYNVFAKNSDNNISLFDILYVEDENLDHIYDDNREGVFSEEMIACMLEESSPENAYIENTTYKNGHRSAVETQKSVFVGNNVDNISYNNGDVIVEDGAKMSILANEKIVLASGTTISKGATFNAKIGNNTYCDETSNNYVKSASIEFLDEKDYDLNDENEMIELIKDYSEAIIMYPNPVTSSLFVSSNKTDNKVAIFNVHGRKILSKSFVKNTEIDCRHLPSGMYMVQVTQKNGTTITKQILKQ
ncbi:MAG: T9SS type A sorting domain-containing protein [Bacteroidales bacterium]|nr:T9SS type A sorting domain-containing protein [Bacteroidales bacterium]